MKKLYIRYGDPPLSLPEAVADSATELARLVGVKTHTVRDGIWRSRRGMNSRFYEIEYEEEDDE